ncbi:unnamed protein product [Auanema sp. JU1783]|nr:unnamed protein product [Auanema sp. JU1783]
MEFTSRLKSVLFGSREDLQGDTTNEQRVGKVVEVSDGTFIGGFIPSIVEKQLFPYSRPEFLLYNEDETKLSADPCVRPVVCPKFPNRMPLYAGYAEVINSGKTEMNEDQASARVLSLIQQCHEAEEGKGVEVNGYTGVPTEEPTPIDDDNSSSPLYLTKCSINSGLRAEASFFAILDGHAGCSAAVVSSKCLHEHVKLRLSQTLEFILYQDREECRVMGRFHSSDSFYNICKMNPSQTIKCDQLVIGALQSAFVDMDNQIMEDKQVWRLPGGCAAVAVLVFLGKVYIANAGDCRAVLVCSQSTRALTTDFNPESERKRLQTIAYNNPDFIKNKFSRLEYSRPLFKKDLNSKVLYRDWFMDGWAMKTVQPSDLKPPLISDSFKKKRLLNTIGVSRGFGDHHLLTVDDRIPIKPFLTSVPEVEVLDLRSLDSLTDKDVIIVASDGLWDVLSNEDAALIVRSALSTIDVDDPSRYTVAAQELVIAARGNFEEGRWMMSAGGHSSNDDITVFVIPLIHCIAPPELKSDDDSFSFGSE